MSRSKIPRDGPTDLRTDGPTHLKTGYPLANPHKVSNKHLTRENTNTENKHTHTQTHTHTAQSGTKTLKQSLITYVERSL